MSSLRQLTSDAGQPEGKVVVLLMPISCFYRQTGNSAAHQSPAEWVLQTRNARPQWAAEIITGPNGQSSI